MRNYFNSFYNQFVVIKRVSDQFQGVVEDLSDTSLNVKNAAEFIAEGSAQQAMDVEKCMDLTDDFTLKMGIMN